MADIPLTNSIKAKLAGEEEYDIDHLRQYFILIKKNIQSA